MGECPRRRPPAERSLALFHFKDADPADPGAGQFKGGIHKPLKDTLGASAIEWPRRPSRFSAAWSGARLRRPGQLALVVTTSSRKAE